jgi:hypothetical protein
VNNLFYSASNVKLRLFYDEWWLHFELMTMTRWVRNGKGDTLWHSRNMGVTFLIGSGGFQTIYKSPACQNNYMMLVWVAVHLTQPQRLPVWNHKCYLYWEHSLWLWNPVISLALFQLHVPPLETSSSIRAWKCKCASYYFLKSDVLKLQELKKVQCVPCVFNPLLSLWILRWWQSI